MIGFQGFVRLGSTIKLRVLTTDTNFTPTAPLAAPTAKVYGPGGQIGTTITSTQVGAEVGLYEITITASTQNNYSAGNTFTVLWGFTVASIVRGQLSSFQVN